MSVRIVYRDIAVGSAQDASVTAAGADSRSNVALLPFGASNSRLYVSGEHNIWKLDGNWTPYDDGAISFWTQNRSNSNGDFSTTPEIVFDFTEQYTTTGISLACLGDSYASEIEIEWYRGADLLASQTFYPDAMDYFCEHAVTAFDKVVITLYKTSLPNRRVRLDSIMMGIVRTFYRDELRNVGIEQEIDGSGRELIADALDWTLDSREVVDYIFQFKQPVSAYDGDTLIGVYYITDSTRRSATIYDITCTDAIGVLDNDPYADRYVSGINALALAQDICGEYSVEMDASLTGKTVTGILKGHTRRTALQQLCFAIGGIADTSGSSAIRIYPLPSEVTSTIDENRARLGGSVKQTDIVTKVRLTAHNYSTSGSGESVDVGGVTYYDTAVIIEKDNPSATASDLPNVVEVADATLVNDSNALDVLERLYAWVVRRERHSVSFRLHGERVGDCVETVTPWGTRIQGNYTKGSLTLSGIVVSQAEVTA